MKILRRRQLQHSYLSFGQNFRLGIKGQKPKVEWPLPPERVNIVALVELGPLERRQLGAKKAFAIVYGQK